MMMLLLLIFHDKRINHDWTAVQLCSLYIFTSIGSLAFLRLSEGPLHSNPEAARRDFEAALRLAPQNVLAKHNLQVPGPSLGEPYSRTPVFEPTG
jgi:hypothetical protein